MVEATQGRIVHVEVTGRWGIASMRFMGFSAMRVPRSFSKAASGLEQVPPAQRDPL